jgi:hypothetical protein
MVEINLLVLIGLLILAALSGASTVFFLAAVVVGARREKASLAQAPQR